MFIGQADHNLDAKGRLIVPAKFREQLSGKFIISSVTPLGSKNTFCMLSTILRL